jgi:hypothetical protein
MMNLFDGWFKGWNWNTEDKLGSVAPFYNSWLEHVSSSDNSDDLTQMMVLPLHPCVNWKRSSCFKSPPAVS